MLLALYFVHMNLGLGVGGFGLCLWVESNLGSVSVVLLCL